MLVSICKILTWFWPIDLLSDLALVRKIPSLSLSRSLKRTLQNHDVSGTLLARVLQEWSFDGWHGYNLPRDKGMILCSLVGDWLMTSLRWAGHWPLGSIVLFVALLRTASHEASSFERRTHLHRQRHEDQHHKLSRTPSLDRCRDDRESSWADVVVTGLGSNI